MQMAALSQLDGDQCAANCKQSVFIAVPGTMRVAMPWEELAFTLATALEYFRELGQHGLAVNVVARQTRLAMNVEGQTFSWRLPNCGRCGCFWARMVSSAGRR